MTVLSSDTFTIGLDGIARLKDVKGLSLDDVIYTGPNLPFSGINTGDCLTTCLQKMDERLYQLYNTPS